MSTEYHSSYVGIGLMLRMPEMERMVLARAELVAERARATAPVGDPSIDEHAGLYRDSFEVELNPRGGARHDRPEGVVKNIQPYAIVVEKGTSVQDGYHTIHNALQAAR